MTTTPTAPEPRPERVLLGDLCGAVDDSDQPMCMSCDLATDRLRDGLPNLDHVRCVSTWMADASPADTLRAAASRLRELAAAAAPGKWHSKELPPNGDHKHAAHWVTTEYDEDGSTTLETVADCLWRQADADYIAVMHPGVGRALADWLDAEAATWAGDEVHDRCSPGTCTFDAALATARALFVGLAPQDGPVALSAPRHAPGGVSDPGPRHEPSDGRTACANCGREVENRAEPSMGWPSRDHWVHVPGSYEPCFPERGADSPRAEPNNPA